MNKELIQIRHEFDELLSCAIRQPKVGDRVIHLSSETAGTIVMIQLAQSPFLVRFDTPGAFGHIQDWYGGDELKFEGSPWL